MSKDTNSFGHDKALACESRGFVYKKKRMHRFDTPSFNHALIDIKILQNRANKSWLLNTLPNGVTHNNDT